jgi:spermidine synthase
VTPRGEVRQIPLLGLFVGLGAAAVSTQTLLLRELLGLLEGIELVIGFALACWFAAVAAGAALGGRLAARPDPRHLGRLLHLGGLLALVLPVAQLLLLRLGRLLLDLPPGAAVPAGPGLLLAGLALLPFPAVVGLLFPVGCRLASPPVTYPADPTRPAPLTAERPGSVLGRIYVAEAIGALLGGVLCTTVLALQLGGLMAAGVGSGLLALGLALSLAGERLRLRRHGLAALLALLLTGLGLAGLSGLERQSQLSRLAALAPGSELVEAFDTPHASMLLTRRDEQLTLYQDGIPTLSFPDPFAQGPLAARLLVQHPHPRRVLLLGGGFTGLASQLLNAGMERVVLVEPDRLLVEKLARHLAPRDATTLADPRVELRFADPRRFLASTDEEFDLLVMLQPAPTTLAVNRFFTREFLLLASRVLAADGVIAFSLDGGPNLLGPETADLAATLWRTLWAVFPDALALPGEQVTLLAAKEQGVLSADIDLLDERLERLPGRTDAFSAPMLAEVAPPGRLRRLLVELWSRDVQQNRDFRPTAPLYSLLLLAKRDRGPARDEDPADPALAFLRSLAQRDRRLPAVFFGLLLLPAALVLRRRLRRGGRPRGAVGLSLLLVGFWSMALELTGLLAFQEQSGALYALLALLVALFMAGLAGGAAAAIRWLVRGRAGEGTQVLVLLGLALLLLTVGLSPLLRLLGDGVALPVALLVCGLLLGLAGALTGAAFPLLAEQAGPPRGPAELARRAGTADLYDHLGAGLGSLLTGSLLLPLFGLTGVALILAVAATALVTIWWPGATPGARP